MGRRYWRIGAVIVVIAAVAASAWWLMKTSGPRVYADVNDVPAGGITIDDIDQRWTVDLPEGWRFKIERHEKWGEVRAIGPTADAKLLDGGYAVNRGDSLCEIYTNWGTSNGATQADKNAELPAKLERAKVWVADGHSDSRGPAFAESELINGIGTLTKVKNETNNARGTSVLIAQREAYMPYVALWAHCAAIVPSSASAQDNEKAIQDIVQITRSFRPTPNASSVP